MFCILHFFFSHLLPFSSIYSVISLSWDMLSFKNFYHISWLLSLFEMDSDHLSLSQSLWSSSDSFWLRSVTSRTCETGGLACSENFIGKLKVRTYTLGVLVRIRNILKLRLDLVHIPWCESYKTTTRLIFFYRLPSTVYRHFDHPRSAEAFVSLPRPIFILLAEMIKSELPSLFGVRQGVWDIVDPLLNPVEFTVMLHLNTMTQVI